MRHRTDAPVGDAIVTLNGFFDPSGRAVATLPRGLDTPETSVPRSVMTNGDGYFVFRDLPPGRYAVSALAFGYISSTYPLRVVYLAGSDKPVTMPLRLRKFAAIEGRVVDDLGEPLGGVPVMALRRETIGSRLMLLWSAPEVLTDDRGIYRLAQLPPGRYIVGALSSATTLPASLGAELDAAVSPTAAFEVRRQLLPGGGSDFARSGEGVRVGDSVLRQIGPMPPPTSDGRLQSYATTFFPGTSSATEASVIALESGEQRHGVDLPLRLATTVRVSGVVTGPSGPIKSLPVWSVSDVTIDGRDQTDLVLRLQPGTAISGSMVFEGSSLAAPDDPSRFELAMAAVAPLAGASVASRGVVTPAGTFRFPSLAPGSYVLQATTPPVMAGARWTLKSAMLNGRDLADVLLDATPGLVISDLVIRFSDRASEIAGVLVDANSRPVTQ